MISFFLFLVGLALLVKGADLLVDGASSLAKRLGVSALVIGLTIVAFGTSMPELVVNILAILQGSPDIAIGNIVGSNIANILLILGISAAIYPLAVQHTTVWKEIPFALLAVVVLMLMVNDVAIDGATVSLLTRTEGLVLMGFFGIFLYYVFGIAKNDTGTASEEGGVHVFSLGRSCAMIALGLAGLIVGGKWIVDGAVAFALNMGVSETLIGLTVVAVGTSLPELITSAVAAFKRNADIAIGNVIGSNIFNIFWILGLSAIIKPLPFKSTLNFDLLVVTLATVLLFVVFFIGKRHVLERWQGWVFIALYVFYIIFLVMRG